MIVNIVLASILIIAGLGVFIYAALKERGEELETKDRFLSRDTTIELENQPDP